MLILLIFSYTKKMILQYEVYSFTVFKTYLPLQQVRLVFAVKKNNGAVMEIFKRASVHFCAKRAVRRCVVASDSACVCVGAHVHLSRQLTLGSLQPHTPSV